jgi:hypothetical protein
MPIHEQIEQVRAARDTFKAQFESWLSLPEFNLAVEMRIHTNKAFEFARVYWEETPSEQQRADVNDAMQYQPLDTLLKQAIYALFKVMPVEDRAQPENVILFIYAGQTHRIELT